MDVVDQKWMDDRDRLYARLDDILGDITDTRLVDVLLALANAMAKYSDEEDVNVVLYKVKELSERVDTVEDDVRDAYYDDTELREYAERLETRIEELETQLN